jgi:transcriptional regulator with XRE-family HTH domain
MRDDTYFLAALGNNIRAERLRIGYSQEGLGAKSGLHRTFIGVIERGERSVSIAHFAKIADALHISCSELMGNAEISSLKIALLKETPDVSLENRASSSSITPSPH